MIEINLVKSESISAKLKDYLLLVKLRLSLLVVFSSVVTYLTAAMGHSINWFELSMLALGGFFVTGSANGINQIIEKDFDKLMHRTANRPLATNRISISEAAIFCTLLGLIGVTLIGYYLNKTSSLLALASLLSYAFIYTPLKRVSPISVLVGAFPGAVPAMLGWVAFTGTIGIEALVFFGIQFFWQFPHFWSVAWLLDDDYKRAGFKMLPSTPGRDKGTALQTLAFTLVLIPFGMLPAYLGFAGIISTVIAVSGGIWMSYNAYLLFKSCDIASAKRLMFSAFIYLPLVQLAFWLDKI
ncbi:MAG: protoheme IX farnesyltransferase [Bacteroidetes bacterium]|nr:protoheme IX farnesyltransferase [Bacteroidota bacterium]